MPALVTWDDHEVQNDYADKWSQYFDDPAQFLLRRAAAYQAFYEHMPVRPIMSRPDGPAMRVYDRFTFGDLIEISMIDGRQYRSREACYGPPNKGGGHHETNASCPELLDAGRSMIGFAQEAWLFGARAIEGEMERHRAGRADGAVAQKQDSGDAFWTDDLGRLSGQPHPAAQAHPRQRAYPIPVVIGGDIHSFFANDLRLDFNDPKSPMVATEFVGTSITSYRRPTI